MLTPTSSSSADFSSTVNDLKDDSQKRQTDAQAVHSQVHHLWLQIAGSRACGLHKCGSQTCQTRTCEVHIFLAVCAFPVQK